MKPFGDDDDLDALIAEATKIDSHDHENPSDSADYFSMDLYRLPDGRHFRDVTSSGENSIFVSATGGDWLDDDDLDDWTSG